MIGLLATVAAALTATPCAAIDNATNTAAFAHPGQPATVTHYSDAGERLIYANAPAPHDNAAWIVLHAAEASLTVDAPARKVRLACASV